MQNTTQHLGRKKMVVFSLVILLMLLAGTHLLETVAFQAGLVRIHPFYSSRAAIQESVREQSSRVEMGYRVFIAVSLLVACYHALKFRDWSRRLIVCLLGVDLGVWLIVSMLFFFTNRPESLNYGQILLQSAIILLEVGVLILFTHPAATRQFSTTENEVTLRP